MLPAGCGEHSNDNIVWMTGFFGLNARITGSNEQALRDAEEDLSVRLLPLLWDKDKWIAAHVLLTLRNIHSIELNAKEWNGLIILIDQNGKVTIPTDQMERLQKQWERFFELR